MSSNNTCDLIYFLIVDYTSKKEIWSFVNQNMKLSTSLAQASNKSKEIINDNSIGINKGQKNKLVLASKMSLFYFLNKDNILSIATVNNTGNTVNSITSFSDSIVNEFLDDIEYQILVKYKIGELNNVTKQNLMLMVDKYFSKEANSFRKENKESLYNTSMNSDRSGNGDKILQVTSDVNDMKLDMKNGIKKMVSNVESVRELESKAERISSNSLLFKKDADNLKRITRRRNIKFMIIIAVIGTFFGCYLAYQFIT